MWIRGAGGFGAPGAFRYTGWGTGTPTGATTAAPGGGGDGDGGGIVDVLMDAVQPGDLVGFLRPAHRFYDDFPGGERVPASEAFVDIQECKRVHQVREE